MTDEFVYKIGLSFPKIEAAQSLPLSDLDRVRDSRDIVPMTYVLMEDAA